MNRVAMLRDKLEVGIAALVQGVHRNGPRTPRLPNTLNMTLPEIRGESLVLHLDRRGIYLSSGSACKSGNPAPSHVLLAMGLSPEEAHCSIRLSLGHGTGEEDVDYVLDSLRETLRDTATAVRFVGCR